MNVIDRSPSETSGFRAKYVCLGDRKWYLKGFSYGPFVPYSKGENLPERERMLEDFQHIRGMPHGNDAEWPKVSVVLCTYNGGGNLKARPLALLRLRYPDPAVEFIVVDDGSTEEAAKITNEFTDVIYHHQENRGLSVARNVGAHLATGEIVAYTDDDCEVDEGWLYCMVRSMRDQGVEAIGGPNITPDSDGRTARCVAASPGNPSHVNDRFPYKL